MADWISCYRRKSRLGDSSIQEGVAGIDGHSTRSLKFSASFLIFVSSTCVYRGLADLGVQFFSRARETDGPGAR